jgi:predicted transcriptional regulator
VKTLTEEPSKVENRVSESTIREIAKRKMAVRILKYLLEQDEVRYTQEVADDLDIDEASADFYLKKLVCCDFIEADEQKVDSRVKYYRLLNETAAKRVITYFEKHNHPKELRTKALGEPEEV